MTGMDYWSEKTSNSLRALIVYKGKNADIQMEDKDDRKKSTLYQYGKGGGDTMA